MSLWTLGVWLLISGPIRRHLWKAGLAFLAAVLLAVVLGLILRYTPWERGASFPEGFPLRGRYLRMAVEVSLVACVLVALALFCNPLTFFLVFPVR